jgi:hypothetical protein
MKITPGSRRFAYLTALLLISGFPERALSQTAPPNGAGGQEVPANKSSGAADKAAPPGSQEVAKDTGTTGGSDATKAGAAGNMSPEQAAAVQAALDAQKGATTQADAALAGAAGLFFGVSPQAAKPYMTVTFHYRFAAPVPPAQGTYYVNCMRQDLADNSPDNLGQKNLNAEWQNGVIAGEYSLRMLKNASLYGNYSFRIFGPYKAMVDASTLPTSVPIPPGVTSVEVVQHGKIHDEGRFAFGSYQTVLTAPAETAPRHRMTITWADASVHQDAAIGLFKSGTDNQHSLARMMFANLPGSWDVDAPAELGSYEVRAFIDGGTETTGTRPFKVTWGTVQPVLSGFPAACYPFAYMPIDYANGPSDHNAWIGIFDVTNNGTNTGWSHESLQGKTSGELFLAAPANIGRYDIRMFDGSNNRLARSTAFQVVAGSEAIQLKAAVDSGHIVLTWNNPRGYQGLDGYYVYRGTAAGAESSTPLTVGPIPADRSAAAATAVNTHIDAGAQPGTKYYYVVKPLQIDHTTLGAASNEVSATAVAAAPPSSSDAGGGSGGGGPPSTAATPSRRPARRSQPQRPPRARTGAQRPPTSPRPRGRRRSSRKSGAWAKPMRSCFR